jgi:DNA-binding MarR family transcriptional regulator
MSDEPQDDLTEEEQAVLMEVVNAGDKGVLPDEIALKLKMSVENVEKILDTFEKDGWFYSEEDEE